ncbi:MAG: hypothetical protein O3A63_15350 [Proteobacteria bacterium]|nr:hypothetical protein [Pseudomonadota bacterium]
MKKIAYGILVVLGLIIAPYALMMVASEIGEVVVLTIPVDEGTNSVRLWVVDVEGVAYLRAGDESSGWYQQLMKAPTVNVERNGVSVAYIATPALDLRPQVAEKMHAKYGWRDEYVALLVGGRENAIPVALQPAG